VGTRQALSAPVKRPKNRKAQIALAAAELFCERGYHGVGIDEIAHAVGITGPAVYRHFPNKYAMLVHATRDLTDSVIAATVRDGGSIPPERRLDEVLSALARLGVERRRVGGLYQWEGLYLEPADRTRLRTDLRTLIDRLAQPLVDLRPELAPAQARLLARAVLSLMGSLATHRAAIPAGRAQELLRAAGWSLLRADLDTLTVVPGSPADPTSSAPPPQPSRRETIMAEAVRLFHRHGYHAVTMEEIATASGTRASSLYRHFAGKAELLAAVYYRAADRVADTAAAAVADADGPTDALGRLVHSYVDLVFAHSELITVYQAENTNLPRSDRHELRKAQRLQVEEWVDILHGARPDLDAADCRIVVHAALNLVTDLGRHARYDRSDGFDRVVARLALTVIHGPVPLSGDQAPRLAGR
jgi:AcrR family transcriptional regulator